MLAAAAAAASALLVQSAAAFAPAGAGSLLTEGSAGLGTVTQQRSVVLALTPSDPAGLRVLDSEAGHQPLAAHEFAKRFGPSAASVSAVESWAQSHGLTVTSVSPDNLLVRLTGSTSALGTALGVTFERFRAANGSTYVSSAGTAQLPASLAGDVSAIVGLSDLERTHGYIAHPSATELPGLEYPTSYGPQTLWSLYDAPASQTGQYSTGFAPGVSQVHVYDGSSLEDASILETIDRWVTDDSTSQASFSAGECELLADAAGFRESLDTVLAEAAAQGQTLFTASGDTGSQCPSLVAENGLPLGLPGVNYPASSPYAIGAGGTSVLGKGDEIGWYAGGGGTSLLESTPAWQQNAGGSFAGVKRGVPDVSLDADPESGFEVIIDGKQEVIGGTSADAPSWQGIWARAGGTRRHAGLRRAGDLRSRARERLQRHHARRQRAVPVHPRLGLCHRPRHA